MGKSKEKVNLLGQIRAPMKGIFTRITYMDEESISGQMGESIMEPGNATRCMDLGSLLGLMGGDMRVSMSMIKSREEGYFNGLMGEST